MEIQKVETNSCSRPSQKNIDLVRGIVVEDKKMFISQDSKKVVPSKITLWYFIEGFSSKRLK